MTPNSVRTIIFGVGVPIEVDAVLNETHKSRMVYTQYPVEGGISLSDNSYREPDIVEMTILLSDSVIDTEYKSDNSYEGRATLLYKQILLWQVKNSPIVLTTGIRTYLNMYIEQVEVVRDEPIQGLYLNIKFIELIDVKAGLAELAASLLIDSNIAYSASPKVGIGVI
jgi:hypothetical protein